jgi:glycosyltransferase involved in cell wall biosynthesis
VRVLFLTCHLPYPTVSGGRVREFELLRRAAARGVQVDVCVVSKTPQADRRHAQTFARALGEGRVTVCSTHPHPSGPAQVARHASADARARVARALAEVDYDLVHVEGFYLMQHLPPETPPVLLVEQNVEHELWRQRGNETEAARTRRAEVAAWRSATLCAAVTEVDRRTMLASAPDVAVRVVPDGSDHLQDERRIDLRRRHAGRRGALFVGNFAYEPNLDAARWLLDDVWPLVGATRRLVLVGNAPPAELRERTSATVTVKGRARSLAPHYARADIVVCPLRIGGGVKVKMVEALALGKPIVSTSVGVQGLEGAPVIVRDDARSFAADVGELLADTPARERLSHAAREYARTLPTWDEATDTLLACYAEAVRSNSAACPWPTPTQSVARP